MLCYTKPIGFTDFSKVKQDLIFEIIKLVRTNGSEFAFPSSSIYLENTDPIDPSVYSTEGLPAENISDNPAPDQGDD